MSMIKRMGDKIYYEFNLFLYSHVGGNLLLSDYNN